MIKVSSVNLQPFLSELDFEDYISLIKNIKIVMGL